ncbi:MAG: fibronectin type III domain-containing protein [bacterium]
MKNTFTASAFLMVIFFSLLFLFIYSVTYPQSITNYQFVSAAGSFEQLSGATEVEFIEADDMLSGAIPIGFDFWYIGSRYTELFACSNGYLSFDNLYSGAVWTNDLFGADHSTGDGRPVIAPLWDDLDGNISETSTSKASYKTSGVYPNRVFTFEWLNWQWNKTANQSVISFQVKLYEADGKIEFIYRQEAGAVSSGSASIGITAKSTDEGYFLSLDGTGPSPGVSSTTETTNLNTKPATGQIYRFSPSTPNAPSNLTFTNVTITSMRLNWTDNSNNESAFVIYHSIDNANFEYIKSASANATNTTIEELETGITHYWKVYSTREMLSSSAATGSQSTSTGTMSEVKVIGSSNPRDYSCIYEALWYVSQNGLSGHLILELKSDYNSSAEWGFPINISDLGASADKTITIRPAANATNLNITSSDNSPTIEMYNCKYIIIDGRPGGAGSNIELTIENTNASGNTAVRFYNDASHNQIRYCNLKADNPSTSGGVVDFTSTNVASFKYGQRYNTIENCNINCNKKSANGIYSSGSIGSCGNKYNTVRNNNINDFYISSSSTSSTCGIKLASGNSDWIITGNSIYQTSASSYSVTANYHYGITIDYTAHYSANFIISGNSIGGSSNNCGGTWTVSSGNFNFTGIYLNEPSGSLVEKNKIANFNIGSSTASITGIKFRDGQGDIINNFISLGTDCGNSVQVKGIETVELGTYNFYYNSVYIGGTNTSGSNDSYAFVRSSYGVVRLLNNILYNERTGGSGNHYTIGNTFSSPNFNWSLTSSNYNLLVSANSSTIGRWNSTSQTFEEWKTSSDGDYNSLSNTSDKLSSANLFQEISSGNLHVPTANSDAWFVNGKGYPVSSINDDFDNWVRSTLVAGGCTDIGADEFDPSSDPPPASPNSAPANSTTSTYLFGGQPIGNIAWGANGTVPSAINLKYFTGTQPPGDLYGNYSNCYWEITPTGGAGFTYNLSLNYAESQLGTISSESNIKIAKRDGGSWQFLSDAVVNTANNTVTVNGLTSFSQFTLTDQTSPLPVELQNFSASINGSEILLKWNTVTEVNNYGFEIEKSVSSMQLAFGSEKQNWETVGFVEGCGNRNSPKEYSFTDYDYDYDQDYDLHYRLKQIDTDGSFTYSHIVIVEMSDAMSLPTKFELYQNYPNPFNPTTTIKYSIPTVVETGQLARQLTGAASLQLVILKIYDVLGCEVAELVNEHKAPGKYEVEFNGASLSSGVYFYKMDIIEKGPGRNNSAVHKMILVK